ncbi:hypothetical protein [Paraburkholderia xenovorans]|uniref:hypothetical protein n=1 Tax=Paraburkholderia xenovorans TaxID=36873 RepID=UPI0038BAA230
MPLKTSVLIRTGNQIASGSVAEHLTVDCVQASAKLPLPTPTATPTPLPIAFFYSKLASPSLQPFYLPLHLEHA